MAEEIDSIVSVSINTDSTTVSRLGFGTQLCLSYHTRFADRYRIYTSLSGMAADGFVSSDTAYKMAAAAFAQDPTCEQLIVGRLPAAPTFVTRITVTSAVEGDHIKLKILAPEAATITDPVVTGGTISPTGAVSAGAVISIDYIVQAAATTTTVATALELLTEAVAGVSSTSSTSNVDLTPATAGKRVFAYDLTNCTVTETTADAGYDDELTALELEPDIDWYFVTTDSSSTANVALVAAWVLTRRKMYFAASQSSGLPAGTDTLGSDLEALSNDRTVIIYSKNGHEFADVAWATVIGVQDPGSITAALKTLNGVTPSSLNSTQKNALEVDSVNHYMNVRGAKVTRAGMVASGEWIDIRHGIDALTSRIQEDVFAVQVAAGKVPFTQKGLDMIEAAIRGSCRAFEETPITNGLLVANTLKVIMPKLSAVPSADKQARHLRTVRFSAQIAGAIHTITIVGTLTYASA